MFTWSSNKHFTNRVSSYAAPDYNADTFTYDSIHHVIGMMFFNQVFLRSSLSVLAFGYQDFLSIVVFFIPMKTLNVEDIKEICLSLLEIDFPHVRPKEDYLRLLYNITYLIDV